MNAPDRSKAAARPAGLLARLDESDMFWSFRHSPLVVLAAVVTLVMVVSSLAAPLIAPHNPFDMASISLMDSLLPPVWIEYGTWSFPLGTDDQGRDMLSTILYGSRISILVGFASVAFAMVLGIFLGLVAGYAGGWLDALLTRIADVQLSFPAILIALLIDGIARAAFGNEIGEGRTAFGVLILAIGLSFWVQYARTVRGSVFIEKHQGVCPGRTGDRPAAFPDRVPAHPAQRHGPGAGDRHHPAGAGDHHRGDAVVPRGGRAADLAVAGHPDPHRQRFSVLRRMVDHDLSRHRARSAGSVGQPARRLAARRSTPS
jgi:hypothetical protein